jgi:hypothetical protein
MTRKTGFFDNDDGKPSPIRWVSFTTLIFAIFWGFITFSMKSKALGTNVTCGLLGTAFIPKVTRKFSS